MIQKVSSNAYKLELPPTFKIHPVIHVRYLTRHLDVAKYSSRIPVPEPEVIMDDGSIEYEVESILNHRVRKYGKGSRLEYLIHWKGYSSHDDTWEPLSNLSNCMEILHEYHTVNNIPQPIQMNTMYIVSIETMD